MPIQKLPNAASSGKKIIHEIAIGIPVRTIFTLLAAAICCYLIYQLLPFFLLLFMSLLLAVTFEPIVRKLTKYIRHSFSVAAVTGVVLLITLLILVIIVPPFFEQLTSMYQELPEFAEQITKQFPQLGYYLKNVPKTLSRADASTVSPLLVHLASFSGAALGWVSSLALIFAFQVYLLYDGARVYDWVMAFFKNQNRIKIESTCREVAPIISAYVIGQIITSVLCSIFTFVTLRIIGVPAALVLAVLAGVFDVLPIIGFFVFAFPAAIFALRVSTEAMLIVVVAFSLYHFVETYLISPLVYGNRLRVSGIVVLFALVAGATIGGILGAIAILPIVASYPKIEEIWLASFLGKEVVEKHKEIAEEAEGEDPEGDRFRTP